MAGRYVETFLAKPVASNAHTDTTPIANVPVPMSHLETKCTKDHTTPMPKTVCITSPVGNVETKGIAYRGLQQDSH